MRPLLSLKTLLRTPFKTAMTFLLIAASSFALFSRVSDYAVTAREMIGVKNSYHGTAALDNGVMPTSAWQWSNLPEFYDYMTPEPLTDEQMHTFANLPGAEVKTRYMTGGIMRDYRRLNPHYSDEYDWGYDYTARFVLEGTLVDFGDAYLIDRSFKFKDVKLIAGDQYFEDGGIVLITAGKLEHEETGISIPTDAVNGAFNIPIRFETADDYMNSYDLTPATNSIFYLGGHYFEKDFLETLKIGERYIIIGRYIPNTFDPNSYDAMVENTKKYIINYAGSERYWRELLESGTGFKTLTLEESIQYYADRESESYVENLRRYVSGETLMRLGDNDTIEWCPSFFLKSDTENLAKAMEIANITNQDLHTFDVVYTDDIASIPRFNEKKMTITDGRAITENDADSCVVSQYFADTYGLKVGDTLTIELGNKFFGQNAQLGAVAYVPERMWNPIKTVELKIAGVYLDIDAQNERSISQLWGYSPNTIFVPKSLLPVTPTDHKFTPAEANFYINNIDDAKAFLEKAELLAAGMKTSFGTNFVLKFSDGGWSKVNTSINTSLRTSLINMGMFVAAAVLALILETYLYIGRRSKDYAIMRALGTTNKKARNALALPLAALTIIAIPVGGIIGLIYTSNYIKSSLGSFANADTSLSVISIVLCFVGELAFVSLITALFLLKLGKTPPLALLQGNVIQAKDIAEVKKIAEITAVASPAVFTPAVGSNLPKKGQYSAFRHVMSYIFKHMLRVGYKTAISVILAAVLTGAVGLLAVTKLSYIELYKNVDVKSTATGLTTVTVAELADSDLVKSSYYYGNFNAALNEKSTPLTISNNLARYLQNGDYSVQYAYGYSEDLFAGNEAVCVVGSGLGVNVGDKISIMNRTMYDVMRGLYFADEGYRKTLKAVFKMDGKEFETEEEFQKLVEEDFAKLVKRESADYLVVGVAESDNPEINGGIFAPPSEFANKITAMDDRPGKVEFCEIVLADNEKILEVESLLEKLKNDSIIYTTDSSYYTDTTELDNIRRVRDLLITLFPIAVAAAVLIGATAPLLIIVQSAKEAAIMRILGTTKKRVRCILATEQILLCVFGLIFAAGGLIIYNAGLFAQSRLTLILCGILYLFGCASAALGASISVTSKRVLELLQVKE